MKKKRILAAGIALGMFFTMAVQVFAAPTIEKVQAYVNRQMTFEFDGVKKSLPTGQEVLVYNDRSYVPAKFVAENLGAEVNWDEKTKLISIKSAKPAEEPTPPAVTPPASGKDYRELPLYKENTNFKMSATLLSEDEYGYKINLTLENKEDAPIQLDQLATVVEADETAHSMKKAELTQLDTRWYKDLKKEEKNEGYVRLPKTITEMPKTLHLVFSVKTNGVTPSSETMTFDIKL